MPLAEIVDGVWRPGIGDPTPVGWATVVAYGLAAVACLGAARRGRTGAGGGFWMVLAAGMLALGVNKQLDLQSAFTMFARHLARAQGWYAERRTYQAAFLAAVAAMGVLGLLALAWWSRSDLRRRGLALFGVVFLVAFVVIRASSFHHVDQLLGQELGGLRWNWLLELGGIACVGLGAWWAGQPRSGPESGPKHASPVEDGPIERGGHAVYRYRERR